MHIEMSGGLASVRLQQSEQTEEKLAEYLIQIDHHCEAREDATHAMVSLKPELAKVALALGWHIAGNESGAEPWLPGNVRLIVRKNYRTHAKAKTAPQERLVHGVLIKEV